MELRGSKTELHLLAAFAGECQARSKYDFFAEKAKQDGYEEISGIFKKTADNEKEHAALWWRLLSGGAGETKDNLQNACGGEHHEWAEMYPEFAGDARDEGFESIAVLFEEAARVEQSHEARFQALFDTLEAQQVFSRPQAETWVCTSCGHEHYGNEAPSVCPLCGKAQAYFAIKVVNQ